MTHILKEVLKSHLLLEKISLKTEKWIHNIPNLICDECGNRALITKKSVDTLKIIEFGITKDKKYYFRNITYTEQEKKDIYIEISENHILNILKNQATLFKQYNKFENAKLFENEIKNLENIDLLGEIKRRILLLDGMFIETGGYYTGEATIQNCLMLASEYITSTQNGKEDILKLIDDTINYYSDDKNWTFYDRFISLLGDFRIRVIDERLYEAKYNKLIETE